MRDRLYYEGENLSNKDVILFDDVVSTYSAISSSAELILKMGVHSLNIFTYLKLKPKPIDLEKKIVLKTIEFRGMSFLISILRKEKNFITSKIIGFLVERGKKDIKIITSQLPEKRKKQFMTMLRQYKIKHTS